MGFPRRNESPKNPFGQNYCEEYFQRKLSNKHTARFFEMEKELIDGLATWQSW